jgi:hypothetical protein
MYFPQSLFTLLGNWASPPLSIFFISPLYISLSHIYYKKSFFFEFFASLRSNTSTKSPLKIPPWDALRTRCSQPLVPKRGGGVGRMKWRVLFSVSCILFNQHINIVWQGRQRICCGIGWRDHANALSVQDSPFWLFSVQLNSTYIRTERFVSCKQE